MKKETGMDDMERKKLEEQLLANAAGGTIEESARLAVELMCNGKGVFLKSNTDRDDLVDIEGMQEYFAKKGYRFIPGFGEQQNIFVGPDGLKYGNDYMIYLIKNGEI